MLAVSDLELCAGYLLEQDQQQLQMFALWTALPYLALKLLFVVFYFVAIGQQLAHLLLLLRCGHQPLLLLAIHSL